MQSKIIGLQNDQNWAAQSYSFIVYFFVVNRLKLPLYGKKWLSRNKLRIAGNDFLNQISETRQILPKHFCASN